MDAFTNFNFNIDLLDSLKQGPNAEVAKIIYCFFDLQYNRMPKFLTELKIDRLGRRTRYLNAIEFLCKPEIESVNFSFLALDTFNGKITGFIKYPLEKELGIQKVEYIQGCLDMVESTWYNQIFWMRHIAEQKEKVDFLYEVDKIKLALKELLKPCDKDISMTSPIEMLYLKISQFERISELKTFISVNQCKFKTKFYTPPPFRSRMLEWKDISIPIHHIRQFLRKETEEIAKYVFLTDQPNKDQRKEIRKEKNIQKVWKLVECCNFANPNVIVGGNISILRIASCLQTVLTDEKEEYDYSIYLMHKHTSHSKRLILSDGKPLPDALKLYWARRVNNHFNANLGEYKKRCELEQYENEIYDLLCKLFSHQTIPDMLAVNSALLTALTQPLLFQ